MSTVAEIRRAIGSLTVEERAEITAELCGWADDDWDRQMKRDAESGKFAAINRASEIADAARQTRSLGEILRQP